MSIITNVAKLERIRVISGYSLHAFSEKLKMSHSTLIYILKRRRNPTARTAKKICDVLEMEFDDLFEIKEGE